MSLQVVACRVKFDISWSLAALAHTCLGDWLSVLIGHQIGPPAVVDRGH